MIVNSFSFVVESILTVSFLADFLTEFLGFKIVCITSATSVVKRFAGARFVVVKIIYAPIVTSPYIRG